MYKYFCKLSLGLKFREFYFGFTWYNMPMSKACKIWNKLSRSLSVIYVKRPVCLCLQGRRRVLKSGTAILNVKGVSRVPKARVGESTRGG